MKRKRELCIFIVSAIALFPILLDVEDGGGDAER